MNGAAAVTRSFPYLLLPSVWATRNRARRREKGDGARSLVFGGIGLGVVGALFAGAFWVTWQATQYAELGDYLIRIGLSWLFLTFLSFLAFSGVVASLSTFFLSDDLRLMLAAPVAPRVVLSLLAACDADREKLGFELAQFTGLVMPHVAHIK